LGFLAYLVLDKLFASINDEIKAFFIADGDVARLEPLIVGDRVFGCGWVVQVTLCITFVSRRLQRYGRAGKRTFMMIGPRIQSSPG